MRELKYFPKSYQIHLDMKDEDTFDGEEIILLEVKKPTSSIRLDGKDIKVTKAEVNGSNAKIKYEKDEIVLELDKEVSGEIQLSLKFTSKYGHVTGLYKSHYDGKYIFTTQFEAAHAREAFPCFDEPLAKATFDLSIEIDASLMAISNTKIKSEKIKGNRKIVTFETSPIMSTYLLYIGAGDLECLEERFDNVDIRIVTRKGRAKHGHFAMEATKKFLKYFEDYFDIKYPIDKLDMIAVPDFGSGAMENWGAITYREDALLFDPDHSSITAKQRIAEIISHELVHQWFGNLVTMVWWNDLWLNESFADYMAYKAVDEHYPEMDPWSNFLNQRVNRAYSLDSLNSSHPINVDVKDPEEIREVFDAISYSKGGMVLKMLELYIGETVFRNGLRDYLKKYSYGNAEGEDLWTALAKVSDKPVKKIMHNWLNQMGFPLVNVDLNGSKVKLSQKRFMFMGSDNKKWIIPICLGKKYVLMENDMELEKTGKINVGELGFYRVKYSHDLLEEIEQNIPKMDRFDRWGLQNDTFALCIAGEYPLDYYLSLIEYYKDEEDYLVVMDIVTNLQKLLVLHHHNDCIPKIQKTAKDFCKNVLEKVGWENKKETDGKIRSSVVYLLGKLGDEEILQKKGKKFKEFLKDKSAVHPDMRGALYKLNALQGGDYDEIIELYRSTKNPQEKLQILISLSCFKDEDKLKKALDFSLTKEVRHQNIFYLLSNMADNPYGRELVWPWMKDNWKQIKKIFLHYTWHFNYVLDSFTALADPKIAAEIEKQLKINGIPGTSRALEQMMEKTKVFENFLKHC